MSLREYRRKRNFKRSEEPYGELSKSAASKYIYVIQKHSASHLHYDLRLEVNGVLKSWAVPKGPSLDPKVKHLAVAVEDHPLDYANFEGIIPKGEYGGGTVMVWDTGFWEPLDNDIMAAYKKGDLNFILHGKRLQGRWKLIRIKRKNSEEKQQWLWFKVKDDFSRDEKSYGDITETQTKSAISKKSMSQISNKPKSVWTKSSHQITFKKLQISAVKGAEKKSMPMIIKPELATLAANFPPNGNDWLHEIKWDGYRLIANIYRGRVKLLTRNNLDWTEKFPTIVKSLKSLQITNAILDGELVALNDQSKESFQLLQNSLEENKQIEELVYYAFDLLYYHGYSLLNVPLIERKKILHDILAHSDRNVRYNDHVIGSGKDILDEACQLHLEGIISKKTDSQYISKRTRQWLKYKCDHRQEFVIGGYSDPKSSREYFGALLVGYYNQDKKLIYAGKVGTGFTETSLKQLAAKFRPLARKHNPFDVFPKLNTKNLHWLTPKLVAEIQYLEMTEQGLLRHPSFKGLRNDKKVTAVSLEEAKDINSKPDPPKSRVKFTNLTKVLYPEIELTKGDLLHYYKQVSSRILPHIKNRPLTIVRCPGGWDKQCFYQRHISPKNNTSIKSILVEHVDNEPFLYINDEDGLLELIQMGVLEIHPWGSTIKNITKPDRMVFDLDPGVDVQWTSVIKAAKYLHDLLSSLGLKSFVKTTGGKGLHVVVPIKPNNDWSEVKNFTKKIADLMVEMEPKRYIATMSKAKRIGKVFIDYLRNTQTATGIATYSTRARAGAPIAIPLSWEELTARVKPDSWTVLNIRDRLVKLENDPWDEFFQTQQSIKKATKLLGI